MLCPVAAVVVVVSARSSIAWKYKIGGHKMSSAGPGKLAFSSPSTSSIAPACFSNIEPGTGCVQMSIQASDVNTIVTDLNI